MLTKTEKVEVVAGLQDRFGRQRVSVFADFRGIGVAKLSAFRRELRKVGAEFKVAKKTLLGRALDAVGIAITPKDLEGEIGVIFGYEDQVAPAKAAVKFAKENGTFRVLKGILAGKIIEATEVLALAKLPSREQLLAEVARVLASPVRGLASVLAANIRNLVGVLSELRGKKM